MHIHTEAIISAAHHLPNYNGKCANIHGHNWKVEIDIIGPVDEDSGMVMDFSVIKEIVKELDHKDINGFIENPTAENIVEYIKTKIENQLVFHYDVKVKVWENQTSWASND